MGFAAFAQHATAFGAGASLAVKRKSGSCEDYHPTIVMPCQRFDQDQTLAAARDARKPGSCGPKTARRTKHGLFCNATVSFMPVSHGSGPWRRRRRSQQWLLQALGLQVCWHRLWCCTGCRISTAPCSPLLRCKGRVQTVRSRRNRLTSWSVALAARSSSSPEHALHRLRRFATACKAT